jgi:hypothetical protein
MRLTVTTQSLIFVLFFISQQLFAQSPLFTITGKILDRETNKPLVGATIAFDNGRKGVQSDTSGMYIVQLPRGEVGIKVSYIGYRPYRLKWQITGSITKDFTLENQNKELEEVVIKSSNNQNQQSTSIGLNTLSIKGVKKLPAVMGELDILRSLQTLPGITSVGEGANGVNIRGGNVDQNLIYIDDTPIFNPTHMFGLFSVFPSDAIRAIELYKGGIPARFGGRTSSVMDIKMAEPNTEKFKMNGGIGAVSNRLMLEIPIIKDKLSILSASRLSYNDFWLRWFGGPSISGTKANFYDIANKILFKPNSKTIISFTNYLNNDNYGVDSLFNIENIVVNKTNFRYGHQNYSLRASYYASSKLSFNLTGVVSNYITKTFSDDAVNRFELKSNIGYKNLKLNVEYSPIEKHKFNFGISGVRYDLSPGSLNRDIISEIPRKEIQKEQSYELAAFVADEFEVNKKFSIEYGVRFVQYLSMGPYNVTNYLNTEPRSNFSAIGTEAIGSGKVESSYNGFEPRVAFKYSLSANDAIKFGYNRMQQFIQLVSNNVTPLPTARWKTSDRYVEPQRSNFFSLGYFKDSKNGDWELSAEGYYKETENQLDYRSGANLQLNPTIETQLLSGLGRAYGAEFQITKKKGETSGWISYTYARAFEKMDSEFQELRLNNGEWFPTDYDKPHTVNLMLNTQISKHHSFSWNFTYSTGRPFTAPVGIYQQGTLKYPIYTERNNARIKDYHRLDFSWNITNPSLKEKRWEGSWVFTVYNIYGRQNAYSYFFKPAAFGLVPYQLGVFTTPFLSLSYNFKFM